MTEPSTTAETPIAGDLTLQRTRAIATIVLLGAITAGVVVLTVLVVSLYPSLRATVHNLERVSAATAVSAETFADVSDEAALNMVETSINLNAASVNLNEATANLERNSTDDSIADTIIRFLERSDERGSR